MSTNKVQDLPVEVLSFLLIRQVAAVRHDAQFRLLQVPVHCQGLFEVEELVPVAIDDDHGTLDTGERRSQVVSLKGVAVFLFYRLIEDPVQFPCMLLSVAPS